MAAVARRRNNYKRLKMVIRRGRKHDALIVVSAAFLLMLAVLFFTSGSSSTPTAAAVIPTGSAVSSFMVDSFSVSVSIMAWVILFVAVAVALGGFGGRGVLGLLDPAYARNRPKVLHFFNTVEMDVRAEPKLLRHLRMLEMHKDHLYRENMALLQNIDELSHEITRKIHPDSSGHERKVRARAVKYYRHIDGTLKDKWGRSLVEVVKHFLDAKAQGRAWKKMFERDLLHRAGYSVAHLVDKIIGQFKNNPRFRKAPVDEAHVIDALMAIQGFPLRGDTSYEHQDNLQAHRLELITHTIQVAKEMMVQDEQTLAVLKRIRDVAKEAASAASAASAAISFNNAAKASGAGKTAVMKSLQDDAALAESVYLNMANAIQQQRETFLVNAQTGVRSELLQLEHALKNRNNISTDFGSMPPFDGQFTRGTVLHQKQQARIREQDVLKSILAESARLEEILERLGKLEK